MLSSHHASISLVIRSPLWDGWMEHWPCIEFSQLPELYGHRGPKCADHKWKSLDLPELDWTQVNLNAIFLIFHINGICSGDIFLAFFSDFTWTVYDQFLGPPRPADDKLTFMRVNIHCIMHWSVFTLYSSVDRHWCCFHTSGWQIVRYNHLVYKVFFNYVFFWVDGPWIVWSYSISIFSF